MEVSPITPVHKCRGFATDPWFYHPIVALPTLTMLFERDIYPQLYQHDIFHPPNLDMSRALELKVVALL